MDLGPAPFMMSDPGWLHHQGTRLAASGEDFSHPPPALLPGLAFPAASPSSACALAGMASSLMGGPVGSLDERMLRAVANMGAQGPSPSQHTRNTLAGALTGSAGAIGALGSAAAAQQASAAMAAAAAAAAAAAVPLPGAGGSNSAAQAAASAAAAVAAAGGLAGLGGASGSGGAAAAGGVGQLPQRGSMPEALIAAINSAASSAAASRAERWQNLLNIDPTPASVIEARARALINSSSRSTQPQQQPDVQLVTRIERPDGTIRELDPERAAQLHRYRWVAWIAGT